MKPPASINAVKDIPDPLKDNLKLTVKDKKTKDKKWEVTMLKNCIDKREQFNEMFLDFLIIT